MTIEAAGAPETRATTEPAHVAVQKAPSASAGSMPNDAARPNTEHPFGTTSDHEPFKTCPSSPGAAGQLGGATGDAAAAGRSPSPAGRPSSAKLRSFKRVKSLNDEFEREFWSGTSLNDLYASGRPNAKQRWPDGAHFRQRHARIPKLRERRITTRHAARRRTPRHAQLQREMDVVRVQPVLPGLGGLGQPIRRPVWHRVGHHARLHRPCQHGAGHPGHGGPGIAEALVATAIGLFAAIPAVIALTTASRATRPWPSRWNLHRRVLQHPAAQPGRTCILRAIESPAPRMPEPWRRGGAVGHPMNEINMVALHRRDAGAAGQSHGCPAKAGVSAWAFRRAKAADTAASPDHPCTLTTNATSSPPRRLAACARWRWPLWCTPH